MPLQMYQPSSTFSNVIAVAAGKGGVGKSTVSVNLALALKRQGFEVGILDADLYGPSIRKMMPPDRLPSKEGSSLFPALSMGVKVMSMAFFGENDKARAVRAPVANSLITQFLETVSWGKLDFLIIDFPPGTGDIQLTIAQKGKITAALMVTTPQEVAAIDVIKAIDLFKTVNIPILGTIENMSYLPLETGLRLTPFGKGGADLIAKATGVPLIGTIPIDPLISYSGDKGISLFEQEGALEAKSTFNKLAIDLVENLKLLTASDVLTDFKLVWQEM